MSPGIDVELCTLVVRDLVTLNPETSNKNNFFPLIYPLYFILMEITSLTLVPLYK